MAIGTSVLVIFVVVMIIFVILEGGRISHKILALILIGMVIFGYFSLTNVIEEEEIDPSSVSGVAKLTKIYFSSLFAWTGSAIDNIRYLTNKSVELNWSVDPEENESSTIKETIEND